MEGYHAMEKTFIKKDSLHCRKIVPIDFSQITFQFFFIFIKTHIDQLQLKFHNPEELYFRSFAFESWMGCIYSKQYKQFFLESLKIYSQKQNTTPFVVLSSYICNRN